MPGAMPLTYSMNAKLDATASIGVIALATDATIEKDWRRLLDIEGVGFYVGRVPNSPQINREELTAMAPRINAALGALLPDMTLDCVVYACTSASLFIGEERVAALIREVRPNVPVSNPLTAAKAALRAFATRRLAILTPYVDEVNVPLADSLEKSGFQVAAMGSFFNGRDPEVVRIDRQSILDACARLTANTDADTLFIACTALGASELVAELEHRTGLSVTTSNHAMAWHALRLCGAAGAFADRGALFTMPLSIPEHG